MSLIHSPSIILNGLVAYCDAANPKSYPGSGTTWTDLTGLGNNGTLVNVPTFSSQNGGSLLFDGANQSVDFGAKQFNTDSGTISIWLKLVTSILDGYNGNQRPWGRSGDFEVRWGGTGSNNDRFLATDIGQSSTIGTNQSTQGVWLNTVWYNIAYSWITPNTGSGTYNCYVQGELDSQGTTGTRSQVTSQTGNFYLARSSNSGSGFLNGYLATFSAYNRNLSASEIQQNYNALKSRFINT